MRAVTRIPGTRRLCALNPVQAIQGVGAHIRVPCGLKATVTKRRMEWACHVLARALHEVDANRSSWMRKQFLV
jgi:hypothetical protein